MNRANELTNDPDNNLEEFDEAYDDDDQAADSSGVIIGDTEFVADANDSAAGELDAEDEPAQPDAEHPGIDEDHNEQLNEAGTLLDSASDDEPAAEAEESEFDDTIWERIPGVGAAEKAREQANTDDDEPDEGQLADGLSYTGTDYRVIDSEVSEATELEAPNELPDAPELDAAEENQWRSHSLRRMMNRWEHWIAKQNRPKRNPLTRTKPRMSRRVTDLTLR